MLSRILLLYSLPGIRTTSEKRAVVDGYFKYTVDSRRESLVKRESAQLNRYCSSQPRYDVRQNFFVFDPFSFVAS
jgi:hypothetical protein